MNLRMGIIGGGSIARVHLEAYAAMDNVRLLGLADPNEQILSDVYRSGKIERVTSDYRELINEPNIDVVDICVPHHLHHKITLDALKPTFRTLPHENEGVFMVGVKLVEFSSVWCRCSMYDPPTL